MKKNTRYCRHNLGRGSATQALLTIAMGTSLATSIQVSSVHGASVKHTFATQLQEVRTGYFNGTEYLTVQIPGEVGPASCKGNVLRINADQIKSVEKQQAIENVALSAMLNEDPVLITVPLGYSDCIDGKPTVLDMYLISDQ